jgi:hypothetical protein
MCLRSRQMVFLIINERSLEVPQYFSIKQHKMFCEKWEDKLKLFDKRSDIRSSCVQPSWEHRGCILNRGITLIWYLKGIRNSFVHLHTSPGNTEDVSLSVKLVPLTCCLTSIRNSCVHLIWEL